MRRLIELLGAIPVGRSVSPSELQQTLNSSGYLVDTRTVQRDLRLLQQHFALDCDERSKPHGWRWKSTTARDAVLGLSTPEALSLVLLEQHLRLALPASWSTSLNELFAQARTTLDRLGPGAGGRRWPDKVQVAPPGLGLRPPALPSQRVLAEISEALLHDRQLGIQYRKSGQMALIDYRLHPLGLLLRGSSLYLVALTDADRHGTTRLFAVHRIQEAAKLPELTAVPVEADLASYVAESGGHFGTLPASPSLSLQLQCTASLAHILEESPLSDGQRCKPLADGRFEITAELQPSWELRWWLLAHIDELEIVAPRALREEVKLVLEKALVRHAAR